MQLARDLCMQKSQGAFSWHGSMGGPRPKWGLARGIERASLSLSLREIRNSLSTLPILSLHIHSFLILTIQQYGFQSRREASSDLEKARVRRPIGTTSHVCKILISPATPARTRHCRTILFEGSRPAIFSTLLRGLGTGEKASGFLQVDMASGQALRARRTRLRGLLDLRAADTRRAVRARSQEEDSRHPWYVVALSQARHEQSVNEQKAPAGARPRCSRSSTRRTTT